MRRKNLLTAVCCLFAVGLLAVCSANAAMIAQSGFNNASGIADPSPLTTFPAELDGQGGTGLGWTTTWLKYRPDTFTNGTATVQTTQFTEGDQGVTAGGGKPAVNASAFGRAFATKSDGLILYELDFSFTAQAEDTIFYLSDFGREDLVYDSLDYKGAAAVIAIDNTAVKQYTDGALVNTMWGNSGSLAVNTWYKLGMLLDMDAKTYQVSLDDIDGTTYDGTYDVARPFYQPVDGINGLIWMSYKTTVHFDNFSLTSVSETIVPGDTDGNGIVDETDAAKVAEYWGTTVTQGDYEKGDFNDDGWVNAADASIMVANWGDHNPPPSLESMAAVPEPSTVVLLFGLSLALLVGRRK